MELLRTYGQATTVYFPLVDFGSTALEATPVSFASGDVKIIKDGGAAANTTNLPSHEGNGIYSLVLTATELQATDLQIVLVDQTATKTWEDQALLISTRLGPWLEGSKGILGFQCTNVSSSATTTVAEFLQVFPDSTEPQAPDRLNGRLLLFTSGDLRGHQTDITDSALSSAGSQYRLTFTAVTSAPASGDWAIVS